MTNANLGKPLETAEKLPENEVGEIWIFNFQTSYLAHLVEEMMHEMDVNHFDNRTSHLLVDVLQRETLQLLSLSVESSEHRLKEEMKKLFENTPENIPEPRKKITEQDAILACQESMTRHVSQSSFLQDIKDMQRIANNVRLGVKTANGFKSKSLFSSSRGEFVFFTLLMCRSCMGFFPAGVPPHLPENVALNTLVSCNANCTL
ncbi:hypothetical protein BdWA1_001645 [Babesia duncani]|uniref:Uncharacterized protein n=1 Tax=Babesia duncani TaxID=323732 RepID=A0AAD9PKH0_9APIC|nr:hypothetical protein BdWA1_001645 [Babesia duncani]